MMQTLPDVLLHAILFQLNLPIELRTIIIEDYFPFLPTEENKIVSPFLNTTRDGKRFTNPAIYINNKIRSNCNTDMCLHGLLTMGGTIMIMECIFIISSDPCTGKCKNKLLYVHDCTQSIRNSSYRNKYMVSVCSASEDREKHEKEILQWYRNLILDTIVD